MKQLQDSSLSSVEEKSFDENSSQELSLESLSEISGGEIYYSKDTILKRNINTGYITTKNMGNLIHDQIKIKLWEIQYYRAAAVGGRGRP